MRKILILFLSVFMLASCADEIPHQHEGVHSSRTILAYLVANNNLDYNILGNVVDMYQGLCTQKDACTLLVYYKPRLWQNEDAEWVSSLGYLDAPVIMKFSTDGRGKINNRRALLGADLTISNVLNQAIVLKTYPCDINSLTADNMEKILRYMVEETPSKSYGLIFGSHATSWVPANYSRSFGKDGIYEMNIPDMAGTLSKVFNRNNLDFILWDACMMCSAEVCYEFKDITNYMIASVMESPMLGFPYNSLMHYLYMKQIDYPKICEHTINRFRESGWGTVAAIDCRQIDRLAAFVKANRDLFDGEALQTASRSIQQYGAAWNSYGTLSFDVTDTFVQLGMNPLPDEFKALMQQLVVAKECLDGPQYKYLGIILDNEKFSGIGMYLPLLQPNFRWDAYYKTLSWYKAAGWDEVME